MPHPVATHLETLEPVLEKMSLGLARETDGVRRIRLAEHIDAMKWALRYYRLGIEAEQRALAVLSEARDPTQ